MLKTCSLQYAQDHKFFGPVWHGSSPKGREIIEREGFKIFYDFEPNAQSGIPNGYDDRPYWDGIPAPIHHLGFGVYFTTVRRIAKNFNMGTERGLIDFYIDTKSNDIINFGIPKTMMKWWVQHGYNPEIAKVDRVLATQLLTDNLKSQFDSVWYKGRGFSQLLDGDQVCVYYPEIIYKVDKALAQPGEIGSKVTRVSDGMTGILQQRRSLAGYEHLHHGEIELLTVRWKKGGTEYNVYPSTIRFK